MTTLFTYLFSAIPLGIALLYGSVGEILTEKVGHLNLGIPGIMCVGGAGGALALKLMRDSGLPPFMIVIIAILVSFLCGVIMGGIYSLLTVTLKANQNVTGLAMTTFGVGVMKFIMSKISTITAAPGYLYALGYFRFPFANTTNALKYFGVMLYLGILIAVASAFVLNKTRVGLHLRAIGENPAAADAVGINVTSYKYLATCIGSGIAALGGLFYIMDYGGSPESYKTIESLGWLAVALVIFAIWKPLMGIVGSVLFGLLYLAGSYVPGLFGINISLAQSELLKLLPYVVTVLVLIISSISKKRENQPPAALGLPYFREER